LSHYFSIIHAYKVGLVIETLKINKLVTTIDFFIIK
jgi:hypothetical protein